MLVRLHVDEIHDDDAAEVSEAQLARDRLRRLEVGLEDRVVEVARADEAAGVDIDRRQRLGLVDDQVAARLQLDALLERLLDLVVDVEQVEDRPLAAAALVRRMKPPLSPGVSPAAARAATSSCASALTRARSCSRSSGEPIFCEIPTWSSCGRKTSSRPAIEIWVERRAPLVPIG